MGFHNVSITNGGLRHNFYAKPGRELTIYNGSAIDITFTNLDNGDNITIDAGDQHTDGFTSGYRYNLYHAGGGTATVTIMDNIPINRNKSGAF